MGEGTQLWLGEKGNFPMNYFDSGTAKMAHSLVSPNILREG